MLGSSTIEIAFDTSGICRLGITKENIAKIKA